MLTSIFPPSHQNRLLTIEQILSKNYKQLCLSNKTNTKNSGTIPATKNGPAENQNIKQKKKTKKQKYKKTPHRRHKHKKKIKKKKPNLIIKQ